MIIVDTTTQEGREIWAAAHPTCRWVDQDNVKWVDDEHNAVLLAEAKQMAANATPWTDEELEAYGDER